MISRKMQSVESRGRSRYSLVDNEIWRYHSGSSRKQTDVNYSADISFCILTCFPEQQTSDRSNSGANSPTFLGRANFVRTSELGRICLRRHAKCLICRTYVYILKIESIKPITFFYYFGNLGRGRWHPSPLPTPTSNWRHCDRMNECEHLERTNLMTKRTPRGG